MRVALIGLGASGLFALHGLQNKNIEIHVFDKGSDFNKRKPCPIDTGKITKCPPKPCWPNCTVSDSGGIFNDMKVITSASEVIGGNLCKLISKDCLQDNLNIVKDIILSNSPVNIPEVHPNKRDLDWITERASTAGLTYYYQSLIHCGSDNAVVINSNILSSINKSNMQFYWRTEIVSIVRENDKFIIRFRKFRPLRWEDFKEYELTFDKVIISVGRSGTKWLSQQEFYKDLEITPGQVDIGIRVETLRTFTKEVDNRFYEPKLYYKTKRHNDTVRNFCSNPGGYVTPENHGEYVLVNGYSKMAQKSENNNFAVLVSKVFTLPFRNPHIFSQHVAKTVNMLAGGGPLVQRLGDLRNGKRSKSLKDNLVIPTLEAEPGDISLAYPHRILEGIIEYLGALDILCPGVAFSDTLLYAPEVKSFSDNIPVSPTMQTKIPGIFIIGDCSSHTRSIGHSAVSGLLVSHNFK